VRLIRRAVQKAALKLFPFWEACGLHVVPDHFYYPIPSTRDLDDALFDRVSPCVGIDWNEPEQRRHLDEVFARFAWEVPFERNAGLSLADAAILHAMIRAYRPQRLIEVGSGHSTRIAARACTMNTDDGYPCALTVIDPFLDRALERELPAFVSTRREKVQAVPIAAFADCDLLFIDSSHVAGIASDVTFLQLEVLPRVRPGCLVHFHDILLPGEYWKEWVIGARLFWSEQYLLWAFLLFNSAFSVVWASRYMQLRAGSHLSRVFPFYRPEHHITSFWIRRSP
jgi:predicted O-methyltransferase YrrM